MISLDDVFDRTNYRGRFNFQVQSKLSFSTSGVYSKFGEAPFQLCSRNRISWVENKLLRDDIFTNSRKNIESSDTVQRSFKTVYLSGKNMMYTFYSFLILGSFLVFKMTM